MTYQHMMNNDKKWVKCKRTREKGRKSIFAKWICNRDRWKVWQCVFEKRRRSGNITFSAFRLQDDGDNFAFFSNPVDSRGKVTTNATNNVVFVCSSNRCFFSFSVPFLRYCWVIISCTWSRQSCFNKKEHVFWTIRYIKYWKKTYCFFSYTVKYK